MNNLLPGHPQKAFTLIELLIVVAIILVLIAIALPNLQEARIRAQVARVRSEYQSLATSLECYCLDWRGYPYFDSYNLPARYNPIVYRLIPLTTPVAYIQNVSFQDPFLGFAAEGYEDDESRFYYNYRNHEVWKSSTTPSPRLSVWVLNSMGPDGITDRGLLTELWARALVSPDTVVLYSPTNGTRSAGDMPRTGGATRFKG
jgi:prepilin-type N-terminal cleavage/methylation domain-containing protein